MVEGGVVKVDKTEFLEFFKAIHKAPYIMRLAFSAGIGGLLFGYDTGVISGALLYIKEEFKEVERKTWLQETIVAMAVAGAIVGAGAGGVLNDKVGRKPTMILADILFLIGSIIMALSPGPWLIIVGRVVVGLGVGMASMTSPLYISETSPTKIRGALGATNGLLITGGQFMSYLINLGFTKVKGTWRWMLGVAAVPAAIQIVLMLTLPESPRWLYRQNKTVEAEQILAKIYDPDEVKEEIAILRSSIENEIAEKREMGDDGNAFVRAKNALKNKVVRRGLVAGITVLVAQQFVGINTVMYYSPTIVQLAGFASNTTALALSLVTSGFNAIGSIASMLFVDRHGRRKLMIWSMLAIISCLVILSGLFYEAARSAPKISDFDSAHFGNSTCPAFATASAPTSWNCMTCLRASKDCSFCAAIDEYQPGACVMKSDELKGACKAEKRVMFTQGCPSKYGFLAVIVLALYIITYSPGMGTVPWILNSELYPLRYRGVCGGIGAVTLWTANLVVSETFLTLTDALGTAGTFLLYAAFSVVGLILIFFLVPETKGLPIEEIEKMLERGYRPSLCGGGNKEDNENSQEA